MATHESPAVAIAREHIEAWSNHQFDKARAGLAQDVHITVTTTQPIMSPTDTLGVDKYMEGLIKFAEAVQPGSADVIAAVGDDRNALIMVSVRANFGGHNVTLPAARLYLLDEKNKIKTEQVVFFTIPG